MEDEEDLESLRLAALQTIKPRKTNSQPRHNENRPYYRLKSNSNLIEIVPKDDPYPYSSNVSKTVNSKDADQKKDKRNNLDQEDDKQTEESEEQKTVRSKFRTDSNNDNRKIIKLDEDQLDFECEDLLEINDDDDSLERLMDEMEQEFNDKSSNLSNTQNAKKGAQNSKSMDDPKNKKPVKPSKKLIVIDDNRKSPSPRRSPRRSLSKNNYKRSLSPVEGRVYSPIRSRRYGSPAPKLKSPSPRFRRSPRLRSPSPGPRRSLSPRLRPRLRSNSPKRRTPSPRARRSRSPRLRRSPILRSRRSPSPRLRRSPSPRMRRSPLLRSRRPPSLGRKRRSLSPMKKSLSPRPELSSRSRRPLTPIKNKTSRLHRSPSLSPPRRKRTSPIRYRIRSRSRSPIILNRRSTSPRQRPLRKPSPSRKRSKSPVLHKLDLGGSQGVKRKTPSETKENSERETKTGEVVDPKLEARRKKFESNVIIAPVRKKIRLFAGETKVNNEDSAAPDKIRLKSNKSKIDDGNIYELKVKRLVLKNPKKKQITLEEEVLDFEENPTINLEETDKMDVPDNKTIFSHIPTKSKKLLLNRNITEDIPDQKSSLDSNLPKLRVLERIIERRKAKIVPITYTPEPTETKKKSKRKKEKIILEEDSDSKPLIEITKSRQYVATKVLDEETDNGNDLRAELSRRRAERLKDTKFQPAARIIQSAFEGVVSSKKRTQKSTQPNSKALKKTSVLKGRRVRVVDNASESEDNMDSYEETNTLESMKLKSIGRSAIIKRNKV